jgi:hypothetical protein
VLVPVLINQPSKKLLELDPRPFCPHIFMQTLVGNGNLVKRTSLGWQKLRKRQVQDPSEYVSCVTCGI